MDFALDNVAPRIYSMHRMLAFPAKALFVFIFRLGGFCNSQMSELVDLRRIGTSGVANYARQKGKRTAEEPTNSTTELFRDANIVNLPNRQRRNEITALSSNYNRIR